MTADAAAALDANFAELIRWYADRPGGEVREAVDVTLCTTGLAFRSVNGAVGLRFDRAMIDERIADVTRWYADRPEPWRWLVGPTSAPADLDRHLRAAGFELLGDNAGMALELDEAGDLEAVPHDVEIRPLDDPADLDAWAEINRRALDLDPVRARAWRDAQDKVIGSDGPMHIWIARLHREPVASAALFEGAGVAGIYNVATVPEARGQGIGRAVTARALAAAVVRGHRLAVLGSSDLGYPVYRHLGFHEVSRLRSYALPSA